MIMDPVKAESVYRHNFSKVVIRFCCVSFVS